MCDDWAHTVKLSSRTLKGVSGKPHPIYSINGALFPRTQEQPGLLCCQLLIAWLTAAQLAECGRTRTRYVSNVHYRQGVIESAWFIEFGRLSYETSRRKWSYLWVIDTEHLAYKYARTTQAFAQVWLKNSSREREKSNEFAIYNREQNVLFILLFQNHAGLTFLSNYHKSGKEWFDTASCLHSSSCCWVCQYSGISRILRSIYSVVCAIICI